jgi:valyl-tRNA synthetase
MLKPDLEKFRNNLKNELSKTIKEIDQITRKLKDAEHHSANQLKIFRKRRKRLKDLRNDILRKLELSDNNPATI